MKTFLLRFLGAVLVLVAAANLAVARDIPLKAEWQMQFAHPGVYGDGDLSSNRNATYVNGDKGIQCYLGTGGKNAVLFTYNTGRQLFFDSTFLPPEEQAIWTTDAGLPVSFPAEVNLYMQVKSGYQRMKIGDVVTAVGAVQFRYGGNTYNLRYRNLAVKRTGTNSWLITSFYLDTDGKYPLSVVFHRAILAIHRSGGEGDLGPVGMPIRFEVSIP